MSYIVKFIQARSDRIKIHYGAVQIHQGALKASIFCCLFIYIYFYRLNLIWLWLTVGPLSWMKILLRILLLKKFCAAWTEWEHLKIFTEAYWPTKECWWIWRREQIMLKHHILKWDSVKILCFKCKWLKQGLLVLKTQQMILPLNFLYFTDMTNFVFSRKLKISFSTFAPHAENETENKVMPHMDRSPKTLKSSTDAEGSTLGEMANHKKFHIILIFRSSFFPS